MNKIAYIKDPHLMFGFSNNIRKTRTGGTRNSWEKDILSKLEFIASEMKSKGISILIFSGDIFDRSKRSDWSFNKWLIHKKILETIFLDQGITIYSVQGNHDMFDGKDTIKETIFGEMVENNIINYLTNSPLEFHTPSGIIQIHGMDYSFTKEIQKRKFEELNSVSENIICMCVSHTNISPNEEQLTDFTYKELSELYPNINVHLCGHYHLGFKDEIVNNVTFINPWNLTRVTREYQVRMDNHIPEMVIVDLDRYTPDNTDYIEHIDLPYIPFHEAFNEEVISVLKESQKFKFFEEASSDINLENLVKDDLDDNQLLSVIINSVLSEKSVQEKQQLLNKAISYLI